MSNRPLNATPVFWSSEYTETFARDLRSQLSKMDKEEIITMFLRQALTLDALDYQQVLIEKSLSGIKNALSMELPQKGATNV